MKIFKLLAFSLIYLFPFYVLIWHDNPFLFFALSVLITLPLNAFAFSTVYHKMFSHRSFKPRAWVPYVGTYIASLLFLSSPKTYTAQHRLHHRFSDTEYDPHTPIFGLRFTMFPAFFKNKRLKLPNLELKQSLVRDIDREYPVISKVTDLHMFLSFIVTNTIFFYISQDLFVISILTAFMNVMLHGYANTFFHKLNDDGAVSIVNLPIKASFISPEFNHAQHHDNPKSYDFSTADAKDFLAPIIERFLIKK